MLVESEDTIDDLPRLVDHLEQLEIGFVDGALLPQRIPEPVDQTAPELAAHKDDGDTPRPSRLQQSQDFSQFIQGAIAARQYDVSRSVLHEHHLAREEMAEGER